MRDVNEALKNLVERLHEAAAENLESILLYGSAARGDFHEAHSDLNVLCTLRSLRVEGFTKRVVVGVGYGLGAWCAGGSGRELRGGRYGGLPGRSSRVVGSEPPRSCVMLRMFLRSSSWKCCRVIVCCTGRMSYPE